MIDVLKQQFNENMSQEDKVHAVREFLQILTLKILSEKGWFDHLYFVGGTALRILHNMRRFSEDLDFSLSKKEGFDFTKLLSELTHELDLYGLKTSTTVKTHKTVYSSFLKFSGLLKALGLSSLEEQNLSIKLEIDTRPPEGDRLTSTLINNKTYLFSVVHPDLPSMYATKICACLFRKYQKGRDFYDLVWYLSKKIEPNYTLLNHAIKQVEESLPPISRGNIKKFLFEKLERVDFAQLRKDVERFLEDKNELKLIELETLKNAIESVFSG